MSRKNCRTRISDPQPTQTKNRWPYPFAMGAILAGVIVFASTRYFASNDPSAMETGKSSFPTLGELAEMSDEELSKQDVALVNLRCAEGLPGSENIDMARCLSTLDQWAERVRFETQRHLYRAHHPDFAEHYRNSESILRAEMLIQVLKEDCGVHYNMERVLEVDFTKSQDLFIHGMIGSVNGGTCISMPVLFTAVARRLGYPVRLVTAKAHVLCRWDDGKERFNIEVSNQAFSVLNDEHYMKWPHPITQEEVKAGLYLRSLLPGEELAVFLAARGHCLEDNQRLTDALVCYAQAFQRQPNQPEYHYFLAKSLGISQVVDHIATLQQRMLRPQRQLPVHGAPAPFGYSQQGINRSTNWPPSVSAQQHNVFKPFAEFPTNRHLMPDFPGGGIHP